MQQVLFLIPNLTTGGIQTQVFLLARFLIQNGFEVTVVGFFSQDKEFVREQESADLKILYHPQMGALIRDYDQLSIIKKIKFWWDYIQWLKSFQPNVIMPYTHRIDLFTNVVWRLVGAKVSFSFERGGHLELRKKKLTWMAWFRKMSSPIYVANSHHGAIAMSKIRGLPFKNINVIRNSLDTSNFSSCPLNLELANLGKDCTIYLMVANFFNQKDHLFLIKSWARAALKDAVLIICGEGGSKECKSNFIKIGKYIENNQLSNVLLLGSQVPSSSLYEKADFGLLSSKSEGCPNSIMEYMYFGLPIISRDIPGVREIISKENYPLLCEYNSVENFADTLKWTNQNLDKCLVIGRSNRRQAKNLFVNDNMQQSYFSLIKNSI